jgi:hypothetical protein
MPQSDKDKICDKLIININEAYTEGKENEGKKLTENKQSSVLNWS